MYSYQIGRILSSKSGLSVFGALFFFVSLLLFVHFSFDLSTIIIFAIGSLLFGVITAQSMHKRMSSFLDNSMSREQFAAQQKHGNMLKSGSLPHNDIERVEYLAYLMKMKKLYENPKVKRPIGLLLPLAAASYLLLFSHGITFIRIFSLSLILMLAYSFITTRRTAKKSNLQRMRLTSTKS